VILEEQHAWKAIGCIEDQPEKEQEEQVKAVGDFAEVDERTWYPDLDIKDGDEDQEGAKEDEDVSDDKRQRAGCGERLQRKELTALEPEGEAGDGDGGSLQER